MGAILLDTTVVIDLLRGREGAIGRLHSVRDASGDVPYVPTEELPVEHWPAGA